MRAVAALSAVGCVSAGAVAAATSGSAAKTSTASNRQRAVRDAKSLLAGVVPPPGAVLRSSGAGAWPHVQLLTTATASEVAYRNWTVPEDPASVISFVEAHLPSGSTVVSTGSGGPPSSQSVIRSWPAVPGVLLVRWLEIEVTARGRGGTALHAESQSQWVVTRARSERIPAGVRAVDVTDGVPGKAPFVSRHVTGRAKVRALVSLFDSLGVAQPGTISCPGMVLPTAQVTVTFDGSGTARPLARATVSSVADFSWPATVPGWACYPIGFDVLGHARPALVGNVITPIERLLHVRLTRPAAKLRTAAPDARAQHQHFSVGVQAVFDANGNPVLGANFSPDGSLATPAWSICPPSGQCQPVKSIHGELQPGPEPARTRFVATATYRGTEYSADATWHGQVHALSGPGLRGRPRLGGVVVPTAARWTGGWGNEFDQLGVEACRTAGGRDCSMLGGGELGCPDNSSRAHLEGWFTGWYLFAVDDRSPADEACAGTGYDRNEDLPLWRLGETVVRSAALARITGPPRPQAKILRNAIAEGRTLFVAALDCVTRCGVSLSVDDGTIGVSRRVVVVGRERVGVHSGALKHGRLSVRLYVDDGPAITGVSRFR